jgi:regulator of protease activity HflC (stomatin/prohibitin superfamily)
MDVVTVIVIALGVFALLVAGAKLLDGQFERVVINEYERGLRYDDGRFTGVVNPGAYRLWRRRSRIRTVDIRPSVLAIPGQEVISADGVSIRVSLSARYAIADPATAVNAHESFVAEMYLALQTALRDVVAGSEIDDLLAQRADLGRQIEELTRDRVEEVGLWLEAVEAKDLMFPGDLKKAFAQVVTARKDGLAALERARGETAALRNLGNAARFLESNPALMQLRILQQIGGSAGNTVVLGLPATSTPLPVHGPAVEPPAELPPSSE